MPAVMSRKVLYHHKYLYRGSKARILLLFIIIVIGTCNPTTAAVVKLCITMSCLLLWTFSHRPQSSLTKHTSTETSVLFVVHSNDTNNTINVYAKNVTQCYFKTGMTDVVWFLKYFLSGCMHKIRRPVKLPFGVD